MIANPNLMPLIGVPVDEFPPYQGCVFAAGPSLLSDRPTLLALDVFCYEAFRRLFSMRALKPNRPGDLSERERRVLELSATGKTAGEIASLLRISQRTVHAHLQNASAKLRAGNKTHTVVEALRYAQITV
jgi:DNA-binding CsgD family transcriptional regulator